MVFDRPLAFAFAATHDSAPNSGTLMYRTSKSLILANPSASTGNVPGPNPPPARVLGFRSNHAGAILGTPLRNAGSEEVLLTSPAPNEMFPFEFQKNPFHTHAAVPTGPPNVNSNPPFNAVPACEEFGTCGIAGVPAPLSSSPRNGGF